MKVLREPQKQKERENKIYQIHIRYFKSCCFSYHYVCKCYCSYFCLIVPLLPEKASRSYSIESSSVKLLENIRPRTTCVLLRFHLSMTIKIVVMCFSSITVKVPEARHSNCWSCCFYLLLLQDCH